MLEFKVTISGLKELSAALDKLKDSLKRRALGNALAAGARVVRDDAKQRAPVLKIGGRMKAPIRRKPGTVRNAIGVVKRLPDPKKPGVIRVSVMVRSARKDRQGANSPHDPFYAPFLEFGTKKMHAQPFMRPAAQKLRQALEVIKGKLAEEIVRLGKNK